MCGAEVPATAADMATEARTATAAAEMSAPAAAPADVRGAAAATTTATNALRREAGDRHQHASCNCCRGNCRCENEVTSHLALLRSAGPRSNCASGLSNDLDADQASAGSGISCWCYEFAQSYNVSLRKWFRNAYACRHGRWRGSVIPL
jgi:hypothetical protein